MVRLETHSKEAEHKKPNHFKGHFTHHKEPYQTTGANFSAAKNISKTPYIDWWGAQMIELTSFEQCIGSTVHIAHETRERNENSKGKQSTQVQFT